MCGIAGFNWTAPAVLEKMTESLQHRGPDDKGFYVDGSVSLGHRRLSILDTSVKGRQPMQFENLIIVYNGEIYNFQELRDQLISFGYNFTTGTDTEVILCSYHRWGDSCVEKFNGMWAFCIYDRQRQILFLSRDRFGIKPLYYYFDGERFIFASELKAVREHKLDLKVSEQAVNFFFYQKYIGDDLTIFENCRKLKPSENLIFDLNQKCVIKSKHYNLERKIAEASETPLAERLESIGGLVVDAVEKRLIADVPVGSFLSGGLDSSLISAVIARRRKDFDTFSIGFTDRSYDEVEYSKIVSEYIGTAHHYEYMDIERSAAGATEHIIENMDEPFGDASLLPTYLLSKITRKKVTVSLSGDAGDEVFGGYDTYKAYKFARYVPRPLVGLSKFLLDLLPPSEKKVTLGFKMKRFARDFSADVNRRHLDWMATFNDAQRQELLGDNFLNAESFIRCSSEKTLLSIQLNDIHNYLAEDILKKVDLASMLNSLEARVPYLDYRLVPLVLSLPEKYKIRYFTTKWLLKKIAGEYLPAQIIRRPKRGFTVPVSRWIKESELVREFLTGRRYYEHAFLSYDYVRRLFDAHISGKEDNARHLWLVFVFNCWMYKRC